MSASAASNRPVSANPKDYTGRYVVTHQIQQGETLEKIATTYGFMHWKPIWIYNSGIHKTVGQDPDVIKAGVTIFIPRNAAGYDRVIGQLKAAQASLESSLDQLDFQQEALKYEREASATMWNFASDVLQLGVGLSVKALQALKATKAAKHAVGQAKIAAKLSSNASTREFAEAYASARNRLTKKALAADKVAGSAKTGVRDFVREKSVDASSKGADHIRNTMTGDDDGKLFQHSKNAHKVVKLSKGLFETAISMGDALGELALVALDYVEVDDVSDLMVCLLISGETFDEIQRRTKASATKSAQRLFEHIEKGIEALSGERALLYGK